MEAHYKDEAGQAYFESKRHEFMSPVLGKWVAAKFNEHLSPDWSIVDFGCSSGHVTQQLIGRQKIGVEINAIAARIAREHFGVETVASTSALKSGQYDAFVSHHAMEHVEQPIVILREALRLLKPGGVAIIVVPGECGWYPRYNHWRDEINKHIYSWTPLSLGNLMVSAGFSIMSAKSVPIAYASRFLGPFNRMPGVPWLIGKLRMALQGEAETMLVARKELN